MTQQATIVTESPSAAAVESAPAQVDRWSAGVFWAALAAALPLLLWFGRDHWFFLDDWWALTSDGLTSPGYLDGHYGHWITVVRLDYRLNFALWGLRSYVPYQVPVVLAHVGAAVFLRQVVRRCGARGWIATCAALAFLYFGSGRDNIVFGFQISLTGSLVCGLALFLLSDGPRTVTRRDLLTLGLAVVGLMTSAVFLALLVGFGVTTMLRRGVRVAAFYAVPLGVIYAAWYARYGHDEASPLQLSVRTIRFVGRMFWAVFDALAQGGVGTLLVIVAACGLAAAVRRAWRSGTWGDTALLPGLAVAWLTFAGLTALARANPSITADSYDAGRYVHIGAALFLPFVAVGAEALARRRTLLGAVALVPLAIGLPGNLDRLSHTEWVLRGGNRQVLYAMAHSPFVDQVPPDTMPTTIGGVFDVPLTTGWLARQAAAGHIPEPDGTDPARDLTATSWLVFAQEDGPAARPACPQLARPLTETLQAGDQIGFTGTVNVAATDGAHESSPRRFVSGHGSVIEVLAGPVEVVVRAAIGQPSRVCAPGAGQR